MPEGLGSMLGAGEGASQYLPYVGQAYTAYKAIKGFREGGIKGAFKTIIPFGGSIFGGGGSRRNEMARQYKALVDKFESGFLKPTMESLTDARRTSAPSFRVGSESFRSVLGQFEGAGKSLRDMIRSGDFGSITGRMSELSDLAKRVQKVLGGRGAGPDRPVSPVSGVQNIPVPSGRLERPVLDLPGALHGGGFAPVQSEGHRFPVTTTQTPGGMKSRKIRLGETPGILT